MSDRPTRAPIRTTWGIRLSGLVRRTLVVHGRETNRMVVQARPEEVLTH
jgi:hypothetical protein